jgi:Domain of unknown function (DUF5602)
MSRSRTSRIEQLFHHPSLALYHTYFRSATVAIAATTLAATTFGCTEDTTSPASVTTYGTAQVLGQGSARTFVSRDNSGKIAKLGIAISETALQGLPPTPMPGMPSAAMLTLALPANATNTGIDHIMLDWNPVGHEPAHVYTQPHFDFHFYQVSAAEVHAIDPTSATYATKAATLPTAEYVPTGYAAASVLAGIPASAAAVPFMGLHWLDVASPELQPPPAGKTFTTTFIYGSFDGKFIFLEPMITKAYIESMKTSAAGVTMPIGVPAKVAHPGLYPSAYSIRYDASAKEYRVTLEGLTQRQ